MVSKIFDETPCFRFFGVKSDSRRLLDEDDAQGLDNIAQEFAPLSNMTGLRLVSFEEQPPMVSCQLPPFPFQAGHLNTTESICGRWWAMARMS